MRNLLYVHTPAQLLSSRLPFLLNRGLQPEVACQEVSIEKLDLEKIKSCAEQLASRQLTTTVHAPFNGFNPGSGKKRLRKSADHICQQSLRLAAALQARCVVFHPGIPYQATPQEQELWLRNSLEFWPQYIEQAAQQGTIIAIENIYEPSAEVFLPLFGALGGKSFGHCFDVGHWNIFSGQTLPDWFAQLGAHLKHLHLHDNHGQSDDHLAINAGTVDFAALFHQVGKLATPPSMTLEAHLLPTLENSLHQIQPYLAPLPRT